MFIQITNFRRKLLICCLVGVLLLVLVFTFRFIFLEESKITIGAFIHCEEDNDFEIDLDKFDNVKFYELEERFQRPSKLQAVKLKYEFYPKDEKELPPYIAEGLPEVHQTSEDVIHGYFAILKEAANIYGYIGGCGTVLYNEIPYPYAYRLLSDDMKNDITLQEYKDSFKGTGATNLIQLTPAYRPPNTPDNIDYYFVEVEVLKGHEFKEADKNIKSNYFEYYYGIVTTEKDEKEGWKIKSVDYLPEIYLCHPMHGWDYDYEWIIGTIYNGWYEMEINIDRVEMNNNYIEAYASNDYKEYKFDFVRLTNGDDILLHEYIKENNKWIEVSILKPEHEEYYKVSILKYNSE